MAEFLDIAAQGSFSTTQLMIEPHKSVTPCAFPKPSASTPAETKFFDVAKPRILPVESKIGPPEFPGFIAAVIVKVPAFDFMEEMIPVVNIPAWPSGDPITPIHQPCLGADPIHSVPGILVLVTIPATSLFSFQAIINPSTVVLLLKTNETFLEPRQLSIT